MLYEIENMPGSATVWPLVATRQMTDTEGTEAESLIDEWLHSWIHAFPNCYASRSRLILNNQVLVWAVDDSPRRPMGITGDLTGTELDPLYRQLDAFAARQIPALSIRPNEALIIDDAVVPFGPDWTELFRQGRLTPDTLILRPSTVDEWNARMFIHRLGDDPVRAAVLLSDHA